MPQFAYKALKHDGALTEGLLDASNRSEAMRQVESRGLKPIKLAESLMAPTKKRMPEKTDANGVTDATPASGVGLSFGGKGKITPRMLENFTRLLSSLLAAGVPFSRALVILHRESAEPVAKAKWKEIHDLVIDGMSLSKAMERSPETFPRVYVAMVEAGETGGFLDLVLAQIADFQAREKELKSKVMTALMYPIILLILALGVLIFLMVFFIPRFQLIFAGFKADLPLITQVIVKTSEGVRGYGLYLAVGVVVAFFSFRSWLNSPKGKRAWEGMLLKLPLV